MPLILLIDDEPAITESLAYALKRAGFEAQAVSTLAAATLAVQARPFDLIILDLLLPDGHGLDWLRQLRAERTTPVMILSSHDEEVDHIVGLEVGADDYVDKPFSPREVVARIRAILRRVEGGALNPAPAAAPAGPAPRLQLDEGKRKAWARDAELSLSKIEFDLLHVFARAPGRVFPRAQLLDKVWGPDVAIIERTVDVHVKSLRKKLVAAGLDADTIETVRGVGYRLREE